MWTWGEGDLNRTEASCSHSAYLPFPLAMERLSKRLGASPHEVAAWLFLSGRTRARPEGMPAQSESALTPGPERGDLRAYLHANELEEPPRFSFDALLPDTACAALGYLLRCPFRKYCRSACLPDLPAPESEKPR